jgi:hypothetical protein
MTHKRQLGQGPDLRELAGELLYFRDVAQLDGRSEKSWRCRAAAGLVPYRRLGGRIVFIRSEIMEFLKKDLPGVSVEQARENVARRAER